MADPTSLSQFQWLEGVCHASVLGPMNRTEAPPLSKALASDTWLRAPLCSGPSGKFPFDPPVTDHLMCCACLAGHPGH